MTDVSNSYRKEVRELLIKRIGAARKKYLDEHPEAVQQAKMAAEKDPVLVELRNHREKCRQLNEEKEEAEKRLREALSAFESFSNDHGLPSYR